MEIERFRQAITNGLGRAILWLRDHPWQPCVEAIEDVCRRNPAFDPQCEGSRAEYVYEAVCLTNERERFAKLVVKALLEEKGYWDAYHLFRVAFLFARNGDTNANNAIYEKFDRDDAEQHFVGADAIINLDGPKGLLYVLDRIGQYIEANPDYWADSCLLDEAEEILGASITEIVREAAETNANIRRYIEAVETHRSASCQQRPDYSRFTYPELREMIISPRGDVPRGALFRWGKHASVEGLREAAADLLNETDDRILIPYVRVFALRPFPLDPRRLVELAASENEELATAARRALRHIQDKSVRMLAVKMISNGLVNGDVVSLLVKNFVVGDDRLFETLLDRECSEDDFHWLAHAAVDVFKANSDGEAGPSMLRIYEKCRCSLCRMGAVEVLMQRQVAPAWLFEECRYDSNLDIRKMVTG